MKSYRKTKKRFHLFVYMFLSSILLWQGVLLYKSNKQLQASAIGKSFIVSVNGNVRKPGFYRVPDGTTQFELLKVVGISTLSDLSPFTLSAQVNDNSKLSVGTLQKPITLKPNVRLEFYNGELSVLASDITERLVQEGMVIDEKDRILTEEKCQAEISINTYSKIDMDNFSEISFDKIGVDSTGKNLVQVFQKNGLCWYNITYLENLNKFQTFSPLCKITAVNKGANYTVEVKYTEVTINVMNGFLLIERPDGSEALNAVSGQTITIFNDSRPFQVSKLAEGTDKTYNFEQLMRTKSELIAKSLPLNILFCSLPSTFYFFSVQYTKSTFICVNLPSATSVSMFAQGFSTLQEAFLYGGSAFTATIVERILNSRIQKYIVFNKFDILRIAATLGGIKVSVDVKAATYLNIKKGTHTLSGNQLTDFLKPAISGPEDSEIRQIAVLQSLFEAVNSRNIIVTALLADQLITSAETNFSNSDIMKYYKDFSDRKNWNFRKFSLPAHSKKEKNQIVYEPILEKARLLINE